MKSTDQKKRDILFFCVNLIAMLRIPNYAIISHTKDSQQHRNWPLFHSVPADAVRIKQQPVCSRTAVTVWRFRSSLLLSASEVFVNFCSVCVTPFGVIGCKRTSALKVSHGKLRAIEHPSLLFYVKHALCILTTIKGIETFSTCATEICFIYPVNENLSGYFASWRVRASCTINTYVCICVVMVESKTPQLLLNSYFPVWCCPDAPFYWGHSDPSTSSELSISLHLRLNTLTYYSIFIFSKNVSRLVYLAWANWLFPHRVRCNGYFRECTCKMNVCVKEDKPKYCNEGWRMNATGRKQKSVGVFLFRNLTQAQGA